MSISRLFSVFVGVALVVMAVLTVRAGIATSGITPSTQHTLDQHERHPGFINSSAADSLKSAANAEQARLEFRRGEWKPERPANHVEFDVEQARIQWRAGK